MAGPLTGLRVLEVAGLGPSPFGAMVLADLGATVTRVDRVAAAQGDIGLMRYELGLGRGRRSVAIDLKNPAGTEVLLRLVEHSDALVEGFRPGTAERLGFGPDVCLAANPRLVYCRVTGWGQTGPLAHAPGHDLNFAAVAGALHPTGDADRPPPPPINYISDLGGGAMFLTTGLLAALYERETSGLGQVIDVAMVDGSAMLTTNIHSMMRTGAWKDTRASNFADGAAPYYRCYATADGGFVAVGAIEPKFYANLLGALGLSAEEFPQADEERWPELTAMMERLFARHPRAHWEGVFERVEACVTPVLTLTEAPHHEQSLARSAFVDIGAGLEPAPAPRFSRSTPGDPRPAPPFGGDTDAVLAEAGFDADTIQALRAGGAVA
jgi:alpha-methylacyl-CoA racemase